MDTLGVTRIRTAGNGVGMRLGHDRSEQAIGRPATTIVPHINQQTFPALGRREQITFELVERRL